MLPIPPAPATLDENLVNFSSVRQEHVRNRATMPILAMRLEYYIFAKNELRCCLLCSLAERLGFFRAVDAIQADALRLFVVQDFDDVAVDNGDDDAGKLGRPAVNYEQ